MISPSIRLHISLAAGLMIALSEAAFAGNSNSFWSVRTWRTDDGLPNNQITGLAQTSDGYLWVATYSCPTRFDGISFEEFLPSDLTKLPSNKCTATLLSRNGGLWIAMLQGMIIRVNPTGVEIFTNGVPDKIARSLIEDHEGALWITYHGGFICRIKDGVPRVFTASDGFPPTGQTPLASLTVDSRGRVWFAKRGRVGVFRDNQFVTLLMFPDVPTRVFPRSEGGVWICSGSRLSSFDEGEEVIWHGLLRDEDSPTEPTALLEDKRGGLWIGTATDGLFRYDDSDFESVTVSAPHITCLMEDQEGNVWAGTDSGGLNRIRPRVVHLETTDSGLPSAGVQSLTEDTHGRIWAATRNGLLASWNSGEWRVYDESWPGGRVSSVAADPSGGVWIGTRDRALHFWHNDVLKTWRAADGLAAREVRSLWVSRSGDVWLGGATPDAIQRLRNGKLENFPVPAGIRLIRAIAEDANGNIWAGTSKGVLLKVSPDGVVTDETARTTGSLSSIRCLHATDDGALWLGYADDGLGWFKDGRFARLTSRHGLVNDTISQIVSDDQGWLWFGSDRGVFKVRRTDLESVAIGRSKKLQSIRYGQSEGLFSLEAATDGCPGSVRKRDGAIWIPMRTGVAVVEPDRIHNNTRGPPVLIKRVSTEQRIVADYGGVIPVRNTADLSATDPVRIDPDHRQVRFDFVALSFSAPENVLVRYRLHQFDRDWIDGGRERAAVYPRLPPGRYRFEVNACNSAGVWNDNGTVLAFTVVPFVWQTWWFRLASLAVTLGTTAGLVRYVSFRRLRSRLQKLEQENALDRERARIARDIHDDLGGRLTEVELLIAMAQRTTPDQRDATMRRMTSAVRNAGESLDEIVWAVNPKHDSLPHLINYLGQYAIQFLNTAGIRCRVDFPEQPPPEPLPPEVRHNLFLAVKEALNNVARHSGATEIWFRFSIAAGSLRIEIEDNGRGLSGAPTDPGADGLGNMRQRVEELGGEFRIDTGAAGGARISLLVPWPQVASRSIARRIPINS